MTTEGAQLVSSVQEPGMQLKLPYSTGHLPTNHHSAGANRMQVKFTSWMRAKCFFNLTHYSLLSSPPTLLVPYSTSPAFLTWLSRRLVPFCNQTPVLKAPSQAPRKVWEERQHCREVVGFFKEDRKQAQPYFSTVSLSYIWLKWKLYLCTAQERSHPLRTLMHREVQTHPQQWEEVRRTL